MELRIDMVTGTSAARALRAEWELLSQETAVPSIYNTFDYVMTSWSTFHGDKSEILVITVRDEAHRLVGLAPLRRRVRRRGLISETVMEPAHTIDVDRPGLLARAGREAEVTLAIFDRALEIDWDVWELPELAVGSVLSEALEKRSAAEDTLESVREPFGTAWLIDLDQTWEASVGSRKSVRRALKRFERAHPAWTIDRHLVPESIPDGLDAFEQVARGSWKPGAIGAVRDARPYFEHLLTKLSVKGRTGIRVLREGDQLMAAEITHTFRDRAFFHCNVFDRAYADLSVGTVLAALIMKEFSESDFRVGDNLTGYAHYMESWSSDQVDVDRAALRRVGPRSRLIDAQVTARNGVQSVRERIPDIARAR